MQATAFSETELPQLVQNTLPDGGDVACVG